MEKKNCFGISLVTSFELFADKNLFWIVEQNDNAIEKLVSI